MYPNLEDILKEMWVDNYGRLTGKHIRDTKDWDWPPCEDLEQLANELSTEEKTLLAVGEFSEVSELIRNKPHLKKLNKFLHEVFDGHLSERFKL